MSRYVPISKWIRTPYSLSWKDNCSLVGSAIVEPSMGEMRYFGVGIEAVEVVEVVALENAKVGA